MPGSHSAWVEEFLAAGNRQGRGGHLGDEQLDEAPLLVPDGADPHGDVVGARSWFPARDGHPPGGQLERSLLPVLRDAQSAAVDRLAPGGDLVHDDRSAGGDVRRADQPVGAAEAGVIAPRVAVLERPAARGCLRPGGGAVRRDDRDDRLPRQCAAERRERDARRPAAVHPMRPRCIGITVQLAGEGSRCGQRADRTLGPRSRVSRGVESREGVGAHEAVRIPIVVNGSGHRGAEVRRALAVHKPERVPVLMRPMVKRARRIDDAAAAQDVVSRFEVEAPALARRRPTVKADHDRVKRAHVVTIVNRRLRCGPDDGAPVQGVTLLLGHRNVEPGRDRGRDLERPLSGLLPDAGHAGALVKCPPTDFDNGAEHHRVCVLRETHGRRARQRRLPPAP